MPELTTPDRTPVQAAAGTPGSSILARAVPRARTGLVRRERVAPDAGALARRRLAVSLLKRALPLAAFAALALIALWPQIVNLEDRVRLSYRKPSVSAPTGAASVVAPRFQGTDDRDRPYVVSADTAVQASESDTVLLTRPRGDITLEGGAWVMLQSDTGRYHRQTRRLDLAGDVTLFHDAGYELRTDAALVDLRAGTASGEHPVAAQGPTGTLDAVGFSLTERGDVVVFGGPARMVLVPAQGGGQGGGHP